MKKLIYAYLALCLITSPLCAAGPPSAQALLATAESDAHHGNKQILVIFHASWCQWCKKFDEFLADKTVGHLISDNFVVVHVDVQERGDKVALTNSGGDALMDSWKGEGLPFMAILDEHGTKISDSNRVAGQSTNIGYPSKPEEIDHFMQMISSAPHLSADQRAQVRAWLTSHGG